MAYKVTNKGLWGLRWEIHNQHGRGSTEVLSVVCFGKGTSYDSELSVDGRDRGGSLDGGCNAGTFRDQGSDHEETGDRSAQMYCAYFIVLTTDSNV